MPLTDTLLKLQRLQFSNDAGASHDLLPLHAELHELLNHVTLQHGLVRRWIETDPDVAVLRNLTDRWDPSPTSDDVRLLMRRRNESAQLLGYADYPWAILTADGMTIAQLRQHLTALLDHHLTEASAAARQAHVRTMQDWFHWRQQDGALASPLDPLPLLQLFADKLNLQDVLAHTEITIVPEGSCFAACTAPEHFRMQITSITSVTAWRTLFHEFGHVCTYALTPPDKLPLLSAVTDEMLAVCFEHAAAHLLADEALRFAVLHDMQLDYIRAAVSALFELDLWRNPYQAERLYIQHYTQLLPQPDSAQWSFDSFRSIDPMTIHGYALGQQAAESCGVQEFLQLPVLCQQAAELTPLQLAARLAP